MLSESYRIIKNKDGSPRWIFPSNDREARYLKFYPAFNKRNKLLRKVLRILAASGLQKLFTQKVSDKDLSKVPPQLRKHVKGKMDEQQIRQIIRKLVKEAMAKKAK